MSTPLKLVPNTLHCVKAGLAIITLTEGGLSDGAKLLNKVLAEGKVIAGVNPGRLLLCEELRSNASKKYKWGGYRKGTGEWWSGTGQTIGKHNEAVLNTFGIKADPTTLSFGQKSRRQYGTHFEEVKKHQAPSEPSAPVFGNAQPEVVLNPPSAEEAKLLHNALVSVGDCPLPSPTEMKGKGCYPRWVRKCKALGFNRESAKAAWDTAKQQRIEEAPKGLKTLAYHQSNAEVEGRREEAERLEKVKAELSEPAVHSPIAKRKPSAPVASSEGTVLHVKPEALNALLATIGKASIDFDADAGVFTVVPL